jgi:hypothetical protein
MQEWFRTLAAEVRNELSACSSSSTPSRPTSTRTVHSRSLQVRSLDLADTNVTGRKIASIIKGLEDVERFDAIDASRNIKDFLTQQR